MSCCGNSLFNKNSSKNIIKFSCGANGASLVVTNGATTLATIDLCSFSEKYSQFSQNQMYLEAGALNRTVPYNIGTQINFLFIQVKYIPKNPVSSFSPFIKAGDTPTLSYTFVTNPKEVRWIDELMILTGTDAYRIPQVFISNPNTAYDAQLTILTSTDTITYVNPNPVNNGDKVFTIEKLTYQNITSDADKLYISSTAGTSIFSRWQDITVHSSSGDLTINGSIITINDYVQGTINLSFVDLYNANQGYSIIKWALCNYKVNLISGKEVPDLTPPVIHYSPNFTTSIILSDFPPKNASTCGTSGHSACHYPYQGTNGENIILKNDLFTYLVDDATDNRDCYVNFNANNLTIRPVTSSYTVDAIQTLGLYQLTFDVYDNADNLKTDSFILNVKDTLPPELIVSSLGLELINLQSSTAGSTAFYVNISPNNYIIVPNNPHNFNIRFNGTSGDFGYLIFGNIVVEFGSYYNTTAGVIDFVFDYNRVGTHGRIIWNTVTELGVEKAFQLGSNNYGIKWIGFGSLLFGINTIAPPVPPPHNGNYLEDEYGDYIVDENGNYISF